MSKIIELYPISIESAMSEDTNYPVSNIIGQSEDNENYGGYKVGYYRKKSPITINFDTSSIPENVKIISVLAYIKTKKSSSTSVADKTYININGNHDESNEKSIFDTDEITELSSNLDNITRENISNTSIHVYMDDYCRVRSGMGLYIYGITLKIEYEDGSTLEPSVQNPKLFIKQDGNFKEVKMIYKKQDGVWVNMDNVEEMFTKMKKRLCKREV